MVGARAGIALLAFLAVAASATAAGGNPPAQSPLAGPARLRGAAKAALPARLIVRADDPAVGRSAAALLGGKHQDFPRLKISVVTLPPGLSAESQLPRIRGLRGVLYAEPDFVAEAVGKPFKFSATPRPSPTPTKTPAPTPQPTSAPASPVSVNDPLVDLQWHLKTVRAPEAWGYSQGSGQVAIAILDTGIDPAHPDLAAKVAGAQNFTDSPTVDDMHGHGTHVAGIAAAATHNALGVAGTGFASSLLNVKVLGDGGSGYYSWIANGVTWATDRGAKVINLSLGSPYSDLTLKSALDYAASKGVTIVAAAGNEATSSYSYPAAYPACLSVASTTTSDTRSSFSNYGTWVSVAAPGSSIYSALPTHANSFGALNYGYLSGTSMATPVVAGIAGVLASQVSASTVRRRIESTCDVIAGTGTYWKYGRVNFLRAASTP
ncbi:MAG: S8 family serine peptidase [Candidatus Sericytochromatia bacterium]|nr:S8 family serine peptidase [Candidatus Tanganyikabacteria bacterium]